MTRYGMPHHCGVFNGTGAIAVATIAALCLLSVGCATMGPAPAALSAEVGDRIAEMQGLHQLTLQKYFDSERQRVEEFLEQRWIPLYLRHFLGLSGLMHDLETASTLHSGNRQALEEALTNYLLDDAEAPAAVQELASALSSTRQQEHEAIRHVLDRYVEDREVEAATLHVASLLNTPDPGLLILEWAQDAQAVIERQRRAMLQPLNTAEQHATAELARAYADLLKANGVVTARLEAAANLQASQDQLLRSVGSDPDSLRQHLAVISTTVGDALGAAEAILQSADAADSDATRADNAIRVLTETLQSMTTPAPNRNGHRPHRED